MTIVPATPQTRDWLSLLAVAGLWGSAFLFNELALRALTPTLLVAGRILIAVIVLGAVMRASGMSLPKGVAAWAPVAILAVLGVILPFQLTAWGQQHLDSGVTAVLMAIMPLFVLGLAHFFVPGQRVTTARIAGLVIGFAGVVCVIGPRRLTAAGGLPELLAVCAVLGAALSYAVNSVYARRVDTGSPIVVAAAVMLVSGALSAPAAVADLSSDPLGVATALDGVAIAAVLFLGLFCTGLATVLYFRLIQGPGPTFVSLVNYLIPAWAVVAGALFLDEPVSARLVAGLVLILCGIAASELGDRLIPRLRVRRALTLQPIRIRTDRP